MRQHIAEAFRHGAEILADYDAAVSMTFLADDAQQRLDSKGKRT
jgi:hypothetical protein